MRRWSECRDSATSCRRRVSSTELGMEIIKISETKTPVHIPVKGYHLHEVLLVFWLLISLVPAIAQDRVPKIPVDKLTEAQRKATEEYRAAQPERMEGCADPRMDPAKF